MIAVADGAVEGFERAGHVDVTFIIVFLRPSTISNQGLIPVVNSHPTLIMQSVN